jgi:hypothetical protein
MEVNAFRPKYRKTPWIIAGAAYVFFTGFAVAILYDSIGGIWSKLAMVLFIAMAVLFLALLLMTMFMNYPKSIEFGDAAIVRRHLFAPVTVRFDEIQYDEGRRVKIGATILGVSDIKNQSELEILLEGLLNKGLIASQPFTGARGKLIGGIGPLLFWSVFTILFFINTFLVQDNMHTYQVIITLLLYFSCIVYMMIGILRGFRQ